MVNRNPHPSLPQSRSSDRQAERARAAAEAEAEKARARRAAAEAEAAAAEAEAERARAAAEVEAKRVRNAIKSLQFGGADAKLRGVAARPVDNFGGVRLADQCLETFRADGSNWRTSDERLTLVSSHKRALDGQRDMSIEELERAPLPAGMPAFMDACVLPILPDEDPAATPEQMAFAYELRIRSSPAGRCDTVRETHSES